MNIISTINKINVVIHSDFTVNYFLFVATLFCDLLEINWFATKPYQSNDKGWFVARNIRKNKALATPAKISRPRIKAGLQ